MIEDIFYYLTFHDVTHPIVKSKMSWRATYKLQHSNKKIHSQLLHQNKHFRIIAKAIYVKLIVTHEKRTWY